MKKVLVVEDDPGISKALRIRLEAAGYEVYTSEDAYMGLTSAIQFEPDIMILDVTMPAGDGFSVVKRLRSRLGGSRIPFIVMTASKLPEYRKEAEELGAAGFFEKPYESAALLAKISEVLAGCTNVEA